MTSGRAVSPPAGRPPGVPAGAPARTSVATAPSGWPLRRSAPGDRAAVRVGRWFGSWPVVVGTVVLVAAAAVLTARRTGPSLVVLDVVVGGLVLAQLPLLFMTVRHADRAAAELAIHQLDADKHQAAELRELSDTVARLAVELARLNARLRTELPSMRKDGER